MFYEKAVLKHFAKFTGKVNLRETGAVVWEQGVYEMTVPGSSEGVFKKYICCGVGGRVLKKQKKTNKVRGRGGGGGQDFMFVGSVKQITRFLKQQTVLSDKLLGSC